MMNITRGVSSGKTMITFDGVADEKFAPESHFEGLTGEVYVVAAKVKRLNSTAAKRWISCFEGLRAAKMNISFVAVSPAIVEQMNLISNFTCGFPVLSVVLPFSCMACRHDNFVIQSREEALALDLNQVDWPCVHCQQPKLEFDDLPEDYLAFWTRES